jgi:hypothetical protein
VTARDKKAALRAPAKRYQLGSLVRRVLLVGSAAFALAHPPSHAPAGLAPRFEALREWLGHQIAWAAAAISAEFVAAGLLFVVVLLGPPFVGSMWRRWRGVAREFTSVCCALAGVVALAYTCGWPWAVGLAIASALAWPWPSRVVHEERAIEAPITKASEDLLHRERIVAKIVAHLSVPTVRCPRVAVVGAVGSGKSSVANLAIETLEGEGHTVVRFDPWHHASLANSRGALLLNINDGILALRRGKGLFVGPRLLARRLWGKLVEQVGWIDLLDDEIEKRLELGRDALSAALEAVLPPGKRMIVVIDDVERCAPDVAVDLLMNIKEIVDASTLGYLLAFDKEALLARLEKAGDAFPNDPGHLDKVIDLQLELPRPSDDDLARIRRTFLDEIDPEGRVRPAMLEAIEDLLPETLREQKRFLLFAAASLARLPERPKWVELDDGFLALLVLHEYLDAGFLERTLADPKKVDDLDSGHVRDMVTRKALRHDLPTFDVPDAPQPSNLVQRVHARVRELGGGKHHNTIGHLRWLLGASPSGESERLHRLLTNLESSPSAAEWVAGYEQTIDRHLVEDLSAVILIRSRLFNVAAKSTVRADQDATFAFLGKTHEARRLVVVEIRRRGLVPSADNLRASIDLLAGWLHFGGPYAEHLRDEASFAIELSQGLGQNAFQYYDAVTSTTAVLAGPRMIGFLAALRAVIADAAGKTLEPLFETPTGVERLADDWPTRSDTRLIADINSGFLTPDRQARLTALAASPSAEVQTNLLWYLRLLVWRNKGATTDFSYLADFVGAIWKGATAQPLNRRMLGDLDELRAAFVAWGVPEASLPQPAWAAQELASYENVVDLTAVLRDRGVPVPAQTNDA